MTMIVAHRRATILYLALVILLGGASAAGPSINFALQMIGGALAVWSLRLRAPRPGWFALAVIVLAAVQFVPLPPQWWSRLPGRGAVAQGFALVGQNPPWLTVSLSPWDSLASLAWGIPALSLFLAARVHGRDLARPAARIVTGVAALSLLFGVAQFTRGIGYFYAVTNYGKAPGFFANSNHQSLFLLIALVLCVEDGARGRSQRGTQPGHVRTYAPLLLAPLFILGIAVNASLAVTSLLLPVGGALILTLRPARAAWEAPLVLTGAIVLAAAAVAAVALDILPNDLFGAAAVAGIGRHDFWATTVAVIGHFAPIGSGLGTFQDVYHWFENPATVSTIYVNHAHNDLLELLAETGIFGAVAVASFLTWFLRAAARLWRAPHPETPALAATIIVGAALLHSLVDYPLRTAALSGIVALACGIIASSVASAPPTDCDGPAIEPKGAADG